MSHLKVIGIEYPSKRNLIPGKGKRFSSSPRGPVSLGPIQTFI